MRKFFVSLMLVIGGAAIMAATALLCFHGEYIAEGYFPSFAPPVAYHIVIAGLAIGVAGLVVGRFSRSKAYQVVAVWLTLGSAAALLVSLADMNNVHLGASALIIGIAQGMFAFRFWWVGRRRALEASTMTA